MATYFELTSLVSTQALYCREVWVCMLPCMNEFSVVTPLCEVLRTAFLTIYRIPSPSFSHFTPFTSCQWVKVVTVWPVAVFGVNNILLHDMSWISIIVQSFFPGFWGTLVETEQQQMRLSHSLVHAFLTIGSEDWYVRSGIWLKLKVKHTNLKYII